MTDQERDATWQEYLEGAYSELLGRPSLAFSEMALSNEADGAGIYVICGAEVGVEVPYYVGQSGCLRERLYRNHLMGQPTSNARLKKYLIYVEQCADAETAKKYILDNCNARWIEVEDRVFSKAGSNR